MGKMSGKLNFLSLDDCKEIHYSSIEILEETGIKVFSKEALDKLNDFGCDVNKSTSIVKFPHYIIEDCLRYTPRSIRLYGTKSKYDLKIEKGRTYVSTASGYGIIDRHTKSARDGLLSDVSNAALIAENLENIHSVIPFLSGVYDIPPSISTPIILGETLKNTNKSMEFYLTTGSNPEDSRKDLDNVFNLCSIVAGGRAQLRKKPFLMLYVSPISPLVYTEDQLNVLFQAVENNLPVVITPAILAGITGPVTLAGTLLQANAEFLAGVVLANTVKKGASIMYGHANTILDMHTGIYAGGAVEMGILGACISQMGDYYGIPTNGYFPKSDSHVPDQQVGYEKGMQWALSTLSGMNYLSGAGCVESESLVSLEQLVIDNEIIGMTGRILEGIDLNEEKLAVDLIKEVGPGGDFFKAKHTKLWANSEHFIPKISQKIPYRQWAANEEKDVVDIAREKVEFILKTEKTPVDKDIIKDIESFQNRLMKMI